MIIAMNEVVHDNRIMGVNILNKVVRESNGGKTGL